MNGAGKMIARRAAALPVFLAVAVPLGLASTGSLRAATAYPTVAPAQVAEWQEKGEAFLFVDTRTQAVFDVKHARGAMNVPAFAFSAKALPRAAKIVLYDAGAGSSEAENAAAQLQSKGHPEFYVLDGGLTAWEAAGLPIVVRPGSSPSPLVEAIGSGELLKLIDGGEKVTILDLRSADLYRQSRVPGAIQASSDSLLDQAVGGIGAAGLVVVYDDGGGESRDRAESLRRRGFRAVKYLYGGMLAWREKNLRVER